VSGSNTPGQWLQADSLTLAAGKHTIVLARPAGHRYLLPGEWGIGSIGAAALQSEAPEQLRTFTPSSWRTLCGARLDWVETVLP
jgi:hypothetical protein